MACKKNERYLTFINILLYYKIRKGFHMAQYDRKNLSEIADVFKALGHPTLLWIVKELARGECCVCDFVQGVGVDFSTISQHLNVLKKAGVVEDDKRGKNVYYKLVYPCIPWLISRMEDRKNMSPEQIAEWEKHLDLDKERKAFLASEENSSRQEQK